MVRVKDDSGYSSDMEMEINFEMFAKLRNNLFRKQTNDYCFSEESDSIKIATFDVYPYGLYISDELDEKTKEQVRKAFSEVYMGCIH